MKYIIMCGGNYQNWYFPRQLLEVKGEPIVARTIRLLKERGVDPEDIFISSDNPVFKQYAPVLHHENRYETDIFDIDNNGLWTDAFYPTDEPCTYLMGDVVFSPDAIKTIVETETDDIEFFASAPPFSPLYTKPWAEPFAFKVVNQPHLRSAIQLTQIFMRQGAFRRKPIAWELWQVIKTQALNVIEYDSYVHINDYTCDVDGPEDLAKIEEKMPYETSMERIG